MIYFIRRHSDNAIKIGVTGNPINRLRTLEIEHGQITFLGWIPGQGGMESDLHKMFADSHLELEWFKESYRLMAFIENNACKVHPSDWETYLFHILKTGTSWTAFIDNQRLVQENQMLNWQMKNMLRSMIWWMEQLRDTKEQLSDLYDYVQQAKWASKTGEVIKRSRVIIRRIENVIQGHISAWEYDYDFTEAKDYWHKKFNVPTYEDKPKQMEFTDTGSRFTIGSQFSEHERLNTDDK